MNKALKLIRVFHNVSQKDLAKMLGITAAHLCEVEKGKKNVTMDLLESYSRVFKLPISSIVYFCENSEEVNKRKPISNKAIKMLEWVEDSIL